MGTYWKTIIALVFLPLLIASIFVYQAEMMIFIVRFPQTKFRSWNSGILYRRALTALIAS